MRTRQLNALLSSTSDPAYAVDGSGRIAGWNIAAETYFAVTARDAMGKSCHSIVQGTDECGVVCGPNCSTKQAIRGNRPVGNFDLMVKSADGGKWCNVSVLLMNNEDTRSQVDVHILRDVDFRKRLELLMQNFARTELGLTSAQMATLGHLRRSNLGNVKLSEREVEVLKLLAKGAKTVPVAQQLHISPSTVNNHVQHIMRKLNASNRLDAVHKAESSGLI
jgi:PAS domain S-box-containing protein